MPDFTKRSTLPEMMDDFLLGKDTIFPIMDELEVINKLLGGYSVFYNAFKKIGIYDKMCICDWGCGGGDSLRMLARWGRKQGLKLSLIGVDATDSAIDYARKHSASYPEISYLHADVMSDQIKPDLFDIVISSLFTHHFENNKWVELIKKMQKCSKKAVIVNDLHRHWFAYHSIGLLTLAFSRSPMVKHDSKLSVLKGFQRRELETLLEEAGIQNYRLKWMWAFRWQLIIYKNDSNFER